MRRGLMFVGGVGCIVTLALAADQVGFTPGQLVDIGGAPSQITRADFDTDSVTDFVTWGGHTAVVTVLHGDGDGTLSGATEYTKSGALLALGVADLNGDGVDDIVSGHVGTWTDPISPGVFVTDAGVHVLLSNDQGGFDAAEVTIHGRQPRAILFLDLDGDTDLDVIVAHDDGTSTLTNDAGVLSDPEMIATHSLTRTRAIADLDDDGNVDLVGNYTLWGEDDGSFTPTTIATADLRPLIAVDLNDDGAPDLVGLGASDPFGGLADVSVALNDGNGGFGEATGFASVRGPLWGGVQADDLNGDDLPELIVTSQWGNVGVLLNEGSGEFSGALTFRHGENRIPWGYTTARVNGDTMPDLVTCDLGTGGVQATIAVHLQSGAAPPDVTTLSPRQALAGEQLVVTIAGADFDPSATVDFGQGVTVTRTAFVSTSVLQATIEIAPFDAFLNPGGVRDVDVRNPDGGADTGSFDVVPGPEPVVTSVRPAEIIAGSTVSLVLDGADFADDVEVTFGPEIVVNGFDRVSGSLLQANVTVAAGAALGAVPFRITNQPTGVFTENAAPEVLSVIGPRTLDLRVRRGDLRDRPKAGRDSAVISGDLDFNAFSPDGAFGIPNETLTLTIGDPTAPFTLEIPAGDPGWTVKKGKSTWKSARGVKPKVKIKLDGVRSTFKVTVRKVDLTLPGDTQILVDLVVGDDTGRDLRGWIQPRGGRLRLR